MPFEFKLPDIGEGVVEGEIVNWLVGEGDAVKEDDPVVEVMTDKATVELTSPRTGSIGRIHAEEGSVVPVGSVLVTILLEGEKDGDVPDDEEEKAGEAPEGEEAAEAPAAELPRDGEGRPAATSGPPPAGPLAMPAVRRLARDLGVDLSAVTGSGPRGRILDKDVRAAAPRPEAASSGRQPATGPPAAPHAVPPPRPSVAFRADVDQRVPFRGLRRKIAERMSESKHRAAHFTYVDEIDCTNLVRLRERAKPRAEARGFRLTYLPFLGKAAAKALEEHPNLNATLDEEAEELILKGECNIGFAVDTERGLLVPVVKGVRDRSVYEIAQEIERLVSEARQGKSRLEDLQGSTFTITSVGSLGGMFATPIINYPEVAILGVNRIEERPVVRSGRVVIRHMSYFSLSLDHRVVDGADGARFLNTFKEYVEEPSLLFLDALE